MTYSQSNAELTERVRALEREKRALEIALRLERERSTAEARRANALEQSSRAAWRTVAGGRRV